MSRIEQLIKEKCPNGVEYRQIKEVFTLFSGMRGVSSKWADNGNCRFIDYMNAYNNNKIDITKLPFATVKNLNQNTLRQGDILLTSASEVPEECAISSVIEDNIVDGIFMDDHLFGLRLNAEYINVVNTTFINYYLGSKLFRKNLYKAVRGVTRFYISNNDFIKLKIPIPPIEAQEEIVKILYRFSELEVELEAELEARKKQYEFWRNNFLKGKNSIIKMNEICLNVSSGKCTDRYNEGKYPVYGSTGIIAKTNIYKYDTEKILIARVGAHAGFVHIAKDKYDVTDNTLIIDLKKDINMKYVYYYLQNYNLNKLAKGGGQPLITAKQIKEMNINFPSLQEQERIVKILDKFDKLINDISEGIPAEIEARRKQYEYYRNKLLSFEEYKNV